MFDAPQYEHQVNEFNRYQWDPARPHLEATGGAFVSGMGQGFALFGLIYAAFAVAWLLVAISARLALALLRVLWRLARGTVWHRGVTPRR